jgi:serpin B
VVLVVVAALAVLGGAACSSSPGAEVRGDADHDPTGPASAHEAAPELWAFAADLHRALVAAGPSDNSVVAPVPIALGLAQARAGAGGATAAQLGVALHVANAGYDRQLDAARRVLLERSGEQEDPDTGREGRTSVELASTLWAQRNTGFESPWLAQLAATWDAGVRVTDFRSDPEAARRVINDWVGDTTNDHITQLLDRGALDQLTRFLATSAAYLKAPWQMPFAPQDTRLAEFRLLDGSTTTVPVMRRIADTDTRVAQTDAWVAVELPYLGSQLTFTAVVPAEGRFAEVERSMDGPTLERLRAQLREQRADVTIPRFGFTSDLRLDDALRGLGVVDAFDRTIADFSGITKDEPLSFWAVAHQSYLAIDEQGTEATATAPRVSTTTTSTTRPVPGTGPTTTSIPTGPTPATDPAGPDPSTATTSPATSGPTATTATTAPAPSASPSTTGAPAPTTVVIDRPFLVLVTDRATGTPLFYGRVVSPGR